uniref:Uncharacterized protein n=1 Tax=Salix viminalis TaxID=40686 RepID=A0A6N2MMA1_SALVM
MAKPALCRTCKLDMGMGCCHFLHLTTGSLYFWAAHLAGPKWGPLASWCCAWLETIGAVAGIGGQETTRAEATSLQEVFSCVCTWVSPSYGRCSTASLYKSLHSLTLSPCGGRLICCLSSYSLFSPSKGSLHEHSRVFISSCNLPPPPRKLKQSC